MTGERYVLDPSLARPERGRALERFVFRLEHAGATVTLAVRPGFVADELIDLARTEDRTPAQEDRLDALKRAMADRVIGLRRRPRSTTRRRSLLELDELDDVALADPDGNAIAFDG